MSNVTVRWTFLGAIVHHFYRESHIGQKTGKVVVVLRSGAEIAMAKLSDLGHTYIRRETAKLHETMLIVDQDVADGWLTKSLVPRLMETVADVQRVDLRLP